MPRPAVFASLALGLASSLLASPALAERVLVEFRSADGMPLVAAGDLPHGLVPESAEETRKRVEARATAIEVARDDLLGALPADVAARVTGTYRHLPLLAMDVDEVDRLELEASPLVVAVHQDRQRRLLTESSLAYIGAAPWHDEGWTGEGTSVAVLDTGIRYWNGFFGTCPEPGADGCRVQVFEGFAHLAWGTGTTDPRQVADLESHGTNVGGIVGDVAPGTDLLSLGVFAYYNPDSSSGWQGGTSANDADVAAAMDWCIEHQAEYNIVAANMSLGSDPDPTVTGYCRNWMAGAYPAVFANARDAGILPVVASGNEYVKTAVSPPSCIASAVRVGAGYDDPAFGYECGTGPVVPGAVLCFSNSNALIDLVAPGNDIDAGGIMGLSGTSMAAPHVAGLVALYHHRYEESAFWTLERIRADAVVTPEIGPSQLYLHRYVRVGDAEADLTFDTGAVLESTFEGNPIPDGNDSGVAVSASVACESELCASGVVGHVYLDLAVEHTRTSDLVIELEGPDGTVARHAVETDDELGLQHVNSILGNQHLEGIFEPLRGGPIEGTWTLRLFDDTDGERGILYRAALLIDSARVDLEAGLTAPAIARPGEPFDVGLTLENRGNLDIAAADLRVELVDEATSEVVDSEAVEPAIPFATEALSTHAIELSGPQGSYEVRVVAEGLEPDLAPGLVTEPVPVQITYRTFASFAVDPEVPRPGEAAALAVTSRGLVDSYRWDLGDGSISRDAEPVHTWATAGDYVVVLEVVGPDGASTTARTVRVGAGPEGSGLDVRGGGPSCSAAPGAPGAGSALVALLGLLIAASLRRRRSRALAALLALAAGAVACGPGENGQPDGGTPAVDEPWLSLLDPADPSAGDLTLWVMLSAEESATCEVALEHRVGEGDYVTSTLADPGQARGLVAEPEGEEHALVWRSTEDIPGDATEVQLRAIATCGSEATATLPVESGRFALLNFLVTHPGAVLITEVSVADDNVPASVQTDYVELHNTTDTALDLEGWTLSIASSGGGRADHPLDGQTLPPLGYLVVGELGTDVEGAMELPEELPWTVQTAGSAAVVATFDRGVDFVRWGGSPIAPPSDLLWADEPPLPIPQTLTVLARAAEGEDSDSSTDFCVGRPSPGEAGEGCITIYEPSDMLITELDSQGTNDQVEVWNASDEPIDIGGWVLLWDGGDLGSGSIPLGAHVIEPGARLVLRDNGVAGTVMHDLMELGENLNIDGLVPIALALQDPHGVIVDFMAAGGSRVRWLDWVEEEPTPMPGPQTTLSRRPGDPDTDSAADFCLTERNLGEGASACLEPLDIHLVITEVMPGRPDWVELWNPGPDPVDLRQVYVSYTAPYYGGSVGDYQLSGTLEPGAFAVLSERALDDVEGEIVIRGNISLAPEGDGSVALRDVHGFGIDFVMWGEPAGTPLWPDRWPGLGADTHSESDAISIQRYPHDAEDTDGREDWCWARPSPMAPNFPCE